MRSLRLILGIGVVLLILGHPLLSQQAIDFVLKDLEGNTIRLSETYVDQVVLIDFWATWCAPCIKELHQLQKIYDNYREKGLTVLSISVDGPDTTALVKNFMRKYQYNFPVLLDCDSTVVSLYNPSLLLPYSVLVDRGGFIRYVHQGYSPGDEIILADEIEKIFSDQRIETKKKISYSLNENFLFRDFSDKDSMNLSREGLKYQILNQLDMTFSGTGYVFGIRTDSDLDFSPLQSHFSLAKRFFELQTKNMNIRFGDFYDTLGRGLLFSLLKTFEREGLEHVVDTTVDGAKIQFQNGPFSLDFMGGWIDRQEKDKKDKIFGGSLAWKAGSFAEIRLNGMYSRLAKGSFFGNKDVFMESVSLDIPEINRNIKFYGEFSLAQKKKYSGDHRQNGFGLYLESGLYFGNLSFLLEFKDYKYLDFEYNRSPLLESEDLDILANLFNDSAENIVGVSGKIDYFLPEIKLLIYSKYSYSEDVPKEGSLVGRAERRISHFYGGIEKKFMDFGYWNVLAGYRDERGAVPYFSVTHGHTFHYQFNLTYPLLPQWSLEADWKHKDFQGRFFSYFERRTFLSLHWTRRGVLTLFYDWTTDPETLAFKNKKDWVAVQLELKISSSNMIRLFIGSSKGSVKCSGGICRYFPPFEGIRIEAILRF